MQSGAAAEADAIREQQLKQTQSGCNRGTVAEGDAIGEQQLKWSQPGAAVVHREQISHI